MACLKILFMFLMVGSFVAKAENTNPTKRKRGKIALIQYDGDIRLGQYEKNLKNLTELTEKAIAQGANIVVMPEGSLAGYYTKDSAWCVMDSLYARGSPYWSRCQDVNLIAEEIPGGKTTAYWEKLAKKKKAYL